MTTTRTDETFDLVNVLGRRLRERRRELGLTLAEVSAVADISVGHCSAIEKGNTLPSLSVLARLAHALQLTLAEVLRASPSPRVSRGHVTPKLGTSRLMSTDSRLQIAYAFQRAGETSEPPVPLTGDDVFLFVHEGAIEIHEGDDHHALVAGDSVHFHAPSAIAWTAVSAAGAGSVWVARALGPRAWR
jgi:transcriptional regulator with XRE-family HTH domain